MPYILGIDQGYTKTAVAVMDGQGAIRGYGVTDGAYFPDQGLDVAMSRIDGLVRRVLEESSISHTQVSRVVAGVTGIDWPNDDQKVADALRETLAHDLVEAYNDSVIALFSGTRKPYGAVLCAGTGANAAIICPDGGQFVMSDYMGSELQGGAALSYRALRKVFDADLGLLPPTRLTELFLDFTGAESPFAMLKESIVNSDVFLHSIIPLVPKILAVADSGDQAAMALLSDFSRELCDYFIAGLRKMDMLSEPFDVVLAGSVFKGASNQLVSHIITRLSSDVPRARVINAKYEPVVGACVKGFLRYESFTQQVSDCLDASAREFGLLRAV